MSDEDDEYEVEDEVDLGAGLGLFGAVASMLGTYDEQRKVAHDVVDGVEIDTAYTDDMGYETAIIAEAGWRPVERYDTREEAEAGHEAWKAKAPKLQVITDLGYPGVVKRREFKVDRA